jgi:glutamate racemase
MKAQIGRGLDDWGLILGGTHYPDLRETIQRKIGRRVTRVDSAEAIADQVRNHYRNAPVEADVPGQKKARSRFFVTDIADQFRKTAHMIPKEKFALQRVDLKTSR